MDRRTAAAVLGVPLDASGRRVTRAYRARVRVGHPDRFPPGSEAWEDANHELQRLNEAMRVLGRPDPHESVGPAARSAAGTAYDAVPSWERSPVDGGSARDTDRRARAWGYSWGGFLVLCAVSSALVGAQSPTNDAFPLWSPALAVIGLIAIAIGWRAGRRLKNRPGRAGD